MTPKRDISGNLKQALISTSSPMRRSYTTILPGVASFLSLEQRVIQAQEALVGKREINWGSKMILNTMKSAAIISVLEQTMILMTGDSRDFPMPTLPVAYT